MAILDTGLLWEVITFFALLTLMVLVFTLLGRWVAVTFVSKEQLASLLPPGEPMSSRRLWTLFAVGVVLSGLSLVSLRSGGKASFLLFPAVVAFLTLQLSSGLRTVLILASCVGLSLLYAFGDPAVAFASDDPTTRRVVWSVLQLVFLIVPFACSFRTFQSELGRGAKTG